MGKSPYEVLGVRQGASQEEIKAAYKELVKKYHPDKYIDNPLADLAKEKLQEVNEAYDALMKGGYSENASAGANNSAGSGTYSSYQGGAYYGASGSIYNQIRIALNNNEIAKAEQLLSKVTTKDAEWYFLNGMISCRRGYIAQGVSDIQRAMEMNPDNQEYRQAYSQLRQFNNMYTTRGDQQAGGDFDQMQMGCNPLCGMWPICLCC